MKKILICLALIAVVIIVGLSTALDKANKEKVRFQENQTALLQDVEYYKTENGRNAASVQKLTLSYDELKKNYDNICDVAKDLGIKVKRMESASATATATDVRIKTVLRDSVIIRDSIINNVRIFRWKDPWVNIFGEINRDSVGMDIQSRDTLIQIVHREPHKFWFFKWGTKAMRQEIVSTNPHTEITYTEYIELKK